MVPPSSDESKATSPEVHAPLAFRVLVQPIVAAFFATRAGRQDALEGRSLFFWLPIWTPQCFAASGTRFEETMHEFLQRDLDYVMRLDEVMWGCLLLVATLIIHGGGLFHTMRVTLGLIARTRKLGAGFGMGVVILATLVIVVFHLIEVAVWAAFFTWTGAQPNVFSAFYNALVNYTTLGAGYLPLRWRLLEGMLGMAGLLSFAFTTSTLITVAQELVRPALIERQQDTESASRPRRTSD